MSQESQAVVYKYLTRSYVEYMAEHGLLYLGPVQRPRNTGYISIPPNEILPSAVPSMFCWGCFHRGRFYEREQNGLSYIRLSNHG